MFVTGTGWRAASGSDYVTVAYSARTGRQLWLARYSSRGRHDDGASSVTVSRAGNRVFVTGTSWTASGSDYATVAYTAATGKRLWAATYHGPASGYTSARSVAVSPDGSSVFVTGTSAGRTTGGDYATVAYSAATGKQLWVRRFNDSAASFDLASSVVVSPDGSQVFVTGTSQVSEFVTIAYSAATGKQQWLRRYRGNYEFSTTTAAVSPGGSKVLVSGTIQDATGLNYATVAYSAATGKQLWAALYGTGGSIASAMAVSPTGTRVFVTGSTCDGSCDDTTVAYSSLTGARLWAASYNGPGDSGANAITVSGRRVFVTGSSHGKTTGTDYATVAYGASTGARLWVARYNGPGRGGNSANAITVSGGRVFVTGSSDGKTTGNDYATVAYSG